MGRGVKVLAAAFLLAACGHLAVAATVCDAKKFGAKADGVTKDTAALQAAIDKCAKGAGGAAQGIVRLTAGTYLSAPLDLKSHVKLQIEKGATLLGSPDMADYPIRADA
jgi:polygalacturonase